MNTIKVDIGKIPDGGLTVSDRLDAQQMELETSQLHFADPLDVTVHFDKQRDTVLVGVGVRGQLKLVCSRCLEPFGQPYQNRFRLGYSIKGMQILDVSDDVRQEILLSYPLNFVCREDCRGLCPTCGTNLNAGACGCSKE